MYYFLFNLKVIRFIGHMNMMYSKICPLDPFCSTQDQIQIFANAFGQGLDINLDMCPFVEKTHTVAYRP